MMTGAELRERRKRLGLTQLGLAEALGLQKNSVAMMERDLRPVRKHTGLAVEYLLLTMKKKKRKRRK